MTIEMGVIENLIIAILIVAFVVLFILLLKNLVKKVAASPADRHDPTTPTLGQQTDSAQQVDNRPLEYKDILKTAHQEAKDILRDTTKAAAEMLTNTKQTNEHLEEQLNKVLQGIASQDIRELKETTGKFDQNYQQSLLDFQKQLQEIALKAIENAKIAYNDKLDSFTSELVKNGMSTQAEVDKKTAELVAKADLEIEEYKKSKINKIDEDVKQFIQKVYTDVLRITIPEKTHEELVLKSLEEAKKEGMFKL